MGKIIIVMGVTGSGKTTVGKLLAQELSWPFYDADDYHPLSNMEKIRNGTPLTDEDRLPWLQSLRALMERILVEDGSAVLTCSALKKAYRDILLFRDPRVQFVYLRGEPDLIRKRVDARTNHYAGSAILQNQFETLEEPAGALAVDIDQDPSTIVSTILKLLMGSPS